MINWWQKKKKPLDFAATIIADSSVDSLKHRLSLAKKEVARLLDITVELDAQIEKLTHTNQKLKELVLKYRKVTERLITYKRAVKKKETMLIASRKRVIDKGIQNVRQGK